MSYKVHFSGKKSDQIMMMMSDKEIKRVPLSMTKKGKSSLCGIIPKYEELVSHLHVLLKVDALTWRGC